MTGYTYYGLQEGMQIIDQKIYDGYAILLRQDTTSFSGTLKVPEYIVADNGKKYAVTDIGANVFVGSKRYTQNHEFTVELGRNVKEINGYEMDAFSGAFNGQTKLTKLLLNPNLEIIGTRAFKNCRIANNVFLPYGTKSVKEEAFRANNIKQILFPSTVTNLNSSAIQDCDQLSEIVVNTTDDHIVNMSTTFDGVPSTASVRVPTGWVNQFKANDKWKKFNITAGGHDFCVSKGVYYVTVLTSSYNKTGDKATYGTAKYVYHPLIAANTRGVYTCTETVIDYENGSNRNYKLVAIGDSCLVGASNINKVDISNATQLTSIGDYAFSGTGITSFTVPAKVYKFGKKAVYGCKSLTDLTFRTSLDDWDLGTDFYGENGSQFKCYVPWFNHGFYKSKLPAGSVGKALAEQLNGYIYPTQIGNKQCIAVNHPVDWEQSGITAWNVYTYDHSTKTASARKIKSTPANSGVLIDTKSMTSTSMFKLVRPSSTPSDVTALLVGVNDGNPVDLQPIGTTYVGFNYQNSIETFVHPHDQFLISDGYAYLQLTKGAINYDYNTLVKLNYEGESSGTKGDVDGNGEVDITDANILINIVLGKDSASNYGGRADVTGEGDIDVSDINAVLNIILGK